MRKASCKWFILDRAGRCIPIPRSVNTPPALKMNPGFCLGSILDHGGWILQFTQTKVSSHFTAKRPKIMVFCYLMIFMFFSRYLEGRYEHARWRLGWGTQTRARGMPIESWGSEHHLSPCSASNPDLRESCLETMAVVRRFTEFVHAFLIRHTFF